LRYFASILQTDLLSKPVGLAVLLFLKTGDSKGISFMNPVLRYCVSTGIMGLFLSSNCYAGVDSLPVSLRQTHDIPSMNSLRSVTILSRPAGARILINGDYVGTTPLLVDVAIDRFGRAIRNIEMRAVAPQPMVTQGIRLFPAAGTDGDASRIPSLVDFDLNIQPVVVIR